MNAAVREEKSREEKEGRIQRRLTATCCGGSTE